MNWISEAAENFQALASMIDAGEVALSEVPEVMLHNLYLVTSYLYYELHETILTDHSFDIICRYLLEHYERFRQIVWWPEKTLNKDLLSAGSGFSVGFPNQVKEIAWEIARRLFRSQT